MKKDFFAKDTEFFQLKASIREFNRIKGYLFHKISIIKILKNSCMRKMSITRFLTYI